MKLAALHETALIGPKRPLEHRTPVTGHVEDDAARLGLAIVPGRALRRLPIAFEHPVAEVALDREDAAEEPTVDESLEFHQARQEQLVLHDAVFDAGGAGAADEIERIGEARCRRLLAIDVLARGNREIEVVLALPGGDRVEIDCVLARGKRAISLGGGARDPMRRIDPRELRAIPPEMDRLRPHAP